MFSEAEYYAAFKKVRNKFRKYRYHDLIAGGLDYINIPVKNNIESVERHPWLVLLFVKWIFLDDQYPNINGRVATKDDVHSLLQLTHELSSKLRMPNDYDHYSLFFRNIAFQQFPYQIDFRYTHLSRQSILFSTLEKNHYIYKEFVRHTGLEVQDFLDLSLMILAKFLNSKDRFLPENWFSTVKATYPTNKVEFFLDSISKDIKDVRQSLLYKDNRKRPAFEHYEATPFIDFPLIKVQGGHALTHKNVLFRRLEHYIYDVMRSINPKKFMDKFGEMFERYVEDALNYSEADFFTERELADLIGMTGNQIDFIIQDAGANIFVDAKAVEMSAQGKTTHSTKILRDKTRDSILKAIRQAHDVIKQISVSGKSEISNSEHNYLIVVTFKELYLGSGTNYYEIIAKDKIEEVYKIYSSYPCISPENMFFITVDDLDILAEILKKKIYSLADILEFSKNNDSDPLTRKFIFTQHIETLNLGTQTPAYLAVEKDVMFERILKSAEK